MVLKAPNRSVVHRNAVVRSRVQGPARPRTHALQKAFATAQRSQPAAVDTAPSLTHLKDPVKIGSSGKSTSAVKDLGGDVSLHRYMTLPIEQYFVLDPSQIRFLGGDRFLLLVPRINIFNVWLEPQVEITVQQFLGPSPRVMLVAQNCRIFGSDLIQQWRLDERFAIRFVTELTWQPSMGLRPGSRGGAAATAEAASSSTGSTAPVATEGGNGATASVPQEVSGQITASAVLEVWSEVIPPFNLMPRELLIASCNAVMAGLVNSLLPLFSRRLAADYQKWAADASYREERAKRSTPLS